MRKLLVALLFSLFLGTGAALAGGGWEDPQQSVPQNKIVVNIPDDGNNWVGPAIGALGALGAAGIGLYAVRSRRKED